MPTCSSSPSASSWPARSSSPWSGVVAGGSWFRRVGVSACQLLVDRGQQLLEVAPVLTEIPHREAGDASELGPGVRVCSCGTWGEVYRYGVFETEDAGPAYPLYLLLCSVRHRPPGQTPDSLLDGAGELLCPHGIGAGRVRRTQAHRTGEFHLTFIVDGSSG